MGDITYHSSITNRQRFTHNQLLYLGESLSMLVRRTVWGTSPITRLSPTGSASPTTSFSTLVSMLVKRTVWGTSPITPLSPTGNKQRFTHNQLLYLGEYVGEEDSVGDITYHSSITNRHHFTHNQLLYVYGFIHISAQDDVPPLEDA